MSIIQKQIFVLLRSELEEIEHDDNLIENTENKILKVWNAILKYDYTLKMVAVAILSIFSSTYSFKLIFLEINFIRFDRRNRITADEYNAACSLLKKL